MLGIKKNVIITTLLVLLVASLGLVASYGGAKEKISLYVNSEQLTVHLEMINNQVYVPVRSIADAFGAKTQWVQETGSAYINSDMPLLSSLPQENIFLYGLNKDKESTAYQDMILSINGVKKVYPWVAIDRVEEAPVLQYMDLNEDKKNELVVILSQGRGTGTSLQTVHVIDPQTLNEYEIEDPVATLKKQASVKVLSSQEASVTIDGKTTTVNLKDIDLLRPGIDKITSDIFYENYITYEANGDPALKAKVGAEIAPLAYLGFFEINYSLQGNSLKVKNIEFYPSLKK